jgi:hypothetical protein
MNQFHDGTDFSQGVDFVETMLGALKVLKLWLCLNVVFFDRSFLTRGVQRFF